MPLDHLTPKKRATVRFLATVAAIAAAALVTTTASAEPPAITAKRQQAQAVLAQVQQLDLRLGRAIEAYNGATLQLAKIRTQIRENRFEAGVARTNLRVAERRLAVRLRALYMSGVSDSTIDVLLGARSLDDVINRLDTANRTSAEDAQILSAVKRFRGQVAQRGRVLAQARHAQERVVARRAAAKAEIEHGLADRRSLLASIKDEIVQLKAQEARRQAELRREAQARIAAQLAQQRARLANTVIGATAQAPTPTAGTPDSVVTAVPPSRLGSSVVSVAMAQLGKPYVWATAGPDTFDCSGLVVYAFAQFGVSLPHFTNSLFALGVYVSRDQLQPGDLVFFDNLGHMGIYIGGGQFIHAPHTGDVVKISSMNDGWYAATYVGARRILG